MWRWWDEAEWGLHVQGPRVVGAVRELERPAIGRSFELGGRCEEA
jgi:hypothetical protein